jgi:hypothetical protein
MADVEFFWDPVCPWAWITSRWVVNVAAVRPLDVDWRFICLRMVNDSKDYDTDFPPAYQRGHLRGLELLRVAAAVRQHAGPSAMLPLYSAYGQIIHIEGDPGAFDDRTGVEGVLAALGHPLELADAAYRDGFDDVVRAETDLALGRCGGNIGTPVLTFGPPDGPSFFGPVINRAPSGADAVELWDAVVALGSNPHFSELKRSLRGRPRFD